MARTCMDQLGKEMIGYCGGLPLAITVLGVNVQPTTIQIPTWFKLNRLRVLKVRNRKYNKRAQDAMQMLISRCPLIENLNLHCRIKRLPETLKFSPNLAKLTLIETWLEEDPMPTLEKLPNLKILRLVFFAFLGENMVCSEGGFPSFNCEIIHGTKVSTLLQLMKYQQKIFTALQLVRTSLEIKDEDKARWSATRSGCYPSAATGNELRAQEDEVEWWRMLWFSLAIPWLPLQLKSSMVYNWYGLMSVVEFEEYDFTNSLNIF
ncbi:disease resistance protein rpp8 [Quercus suber]|uniref:Disease resistance protein rpp8 n=1 Tax=Quercus suber TaxID=58331 RepID=A0AAW0LUH3_QUESU